MCVSYFGNGVFNSLAPVKRGDGVDQPTRMVVEYVSSFFFFSFPPLLPKKTPLSLPPSSSPLAVRCPCCAARKSVKKKANRCGRNPAIEYMTQKYRSAPDNCCGGYKVTPSSPPPSSALPLRLTCRGMRQSRLPYADVHLHQNKVFVFFFSLQQQVFGLFFFFFYNLATAVLLELPGRVSQAAERSLH